MDLRQSTASQEISLGQFLDSTDGDTEENGLTIANTDIKLRKHNTTTLANKNSGGATNISNGVYHATLNATDTDTLGMLEIYVHVAGALAVKAQFNVLTQTAFDAKYTGTFNNLGGTAQTADHTAAIAAVKAETVLIVADTNELQSDDVPTLIAALPTASEINAEVVDVLETDTHAEPSGVVGATSTIKDAIMWIKTLGRNKMTQTATTTLLRNDADSGTISTSTVSDDTTTFIRGKHT